MSANHVLHQRNTSSVWSGLIDSYNAARLVIAVLATASSAVVGMVNGWPRGPWVLIVSVSVVVHAVVYRLQRVRSATALLVIDGLALAAATFVMGIVTVALLALSLMLISAAVLEVGARVYSLWVFDVTVIGFALALNGFFGLPAYTDSQRALSERVGLVFFAVACVAMTRTLVNRLRQIDYERRATKERLSSHDSRYRAMLAYSSDGLAVTDAGLRLIELGVQNERLTGYPSDERIGGSMLDLVIDEDRGSLLEAYNKAVRMPDEPARFHVRIRRRDGEVRLMNATARNLLNDPDLEGFVFNFHDVTEEHELRRSLEMFGVTHDGDAVR
jgi:PAS domain S-box-containing protein